MDMTFNHPPKQYYTAGEMASFFEISKQTLLYYDKIGLLHPEYISENGYREYSIHQYQILEIIVNLRKLGVSLEAIKRHIENRSEASLKELLEQKVEEYNSIIEKTMRIKAVITGIIDRMEDQHKYPLEAFMLEYRDARKILVTDRSILGGDVLSSFSRHNLDALTDTGLRDRGAGWIVSKNDLESKENAGPCAFFSVISPEYNGVERIGIQKAGMYLVKYINGSFHSNRKRIIGEIWDYLHKNELIPVGDLYIMPLRNHWMTADRKEYIDVISICVKYK